MNLIVVTVQNKYQYKSNTFKQNVLCYGSDSFDEGSDILLEQIRDSSRGQLISMNKVPSSFSILSKDMFNKNNNEWSIDIIILNHKQFIDSNTRITINPSKILNEAPLSITNSPYRLNLLNYNMK